MTRRWIALACLLAVLLTACSGARGIQGTYPILSDPPKTEPTQSWRALSEAYLVVADRAGKDFSQLFGRRVAYEDTVAGQHLWCNAFMSVDKEFAESVRALPWTAEYQKQVDLVLKKTDDVIDLLKKCMKSKSLKTIKSWERKADNAYLLRQKASEHAPRPASALTARGWPEQGAIGGSCRWP